MKGVKRAPLIFNMENITKNYIFQRVKIVQTPTSHSRNILNELNVLIRELLKWNEFCARSWLWIVNTLEAISHIIVVLSRDHGSVRSSPAGSGVSTLTVPVRADPLSTNGGSRTVRKFIFFFNNCLCFLTAALCPCRKWNQLSWAWSLKLTESLRKVSNEPQNPQVSSLS